MNELLEIVKMHINTETPLETKIAYYQLIDLKYNKTKALNTLASWYSDTIKYMQINNVDFSIAWPNMVRIKFQELKTRFNPEYELPSKTVAEYQEQINALILMILAESEKEYYVSDLVDFLVDIVISYAKKLNTTKLDDLYNLKYGKNLEEFLKIYKTLILNDKRSDLYEEINQKINSYFI